MMPVVILVINDDDDGHPDTADDNGDTHGWR
jgi:hypothetical protein